MKKMHVLVATIKSWNIKNVNNIKLKNVDIKLIDDKDRLTEEIVDNFNPDIIFFIHWSWYIPKTIYNKYECIVFHPTQLPYGRGGSPIQNLIVHGKETTVISAVKVGKELDAGALYPIQRDLSLLGTADEILMRMSKIVCFDMIPWIISNRPVPSEQEGDIVVFDRRKPDESELDMEDKIENIYNMIRMLDGEGYPKAFLDIGKYRLEFSRASLKTEYIKADIKIIEREVENE